MRDDCANRVVWFKVLGFLAPTLAYAWMRGHLAGLNPLHMVFVIAGVTLIVTVFVIFWRVDCDIIKSGRVRVVYALVFGGYYGLMLYLWGTLWMPVLLAAFLPAVLLGPSLIFRRARR